MSNVSVQIAGNVIKPPEFKDINGTPLCVLLMAHNVGYGNNRETVWCEVNVWGNQASVAYDNLMQGSVVSVAGDLGKPFVSSSGNVTQKIDAKTITFLSNRAPVAETETAGYVDDPYGDEIPF